MDTTYIPMQRGFVYLTAVLDWATPRVLAWRLSQHPLRQHHLPALRCLNPRNTPITKREKRNIKLLEHTHLCRAGSLRQSASPAT